MRDPMLERFFVSCIPRVRHLLHNEYFHLLWKIERTPQLQRLSVARANSLSKIGEIGTTDRQSCTRHHRRAILAKKHAAQNRRDVDRRRVERQEFSGFARALDPIDVFTSALCEEDLDSIARISNSPAQVLQFGFEEFVVCLFSDLSDARLQREQAAGDCPGNQVRLAHAKFPPFPKIAASFHASKEEIDIFD